MTVKDKEILRYSIPNFFPDFMNDFNPEDAKETMEEIGRNRPREGKEGDLDDENEDENREEDNEKKMIYVWKKGMELEERKVVRENQEKIDALYPKKKKMSSFFVLFFIFVSSDFVMCVFRGQQKFFEKKPQSDSAHTAHHKREGRKTRMI